MPKGKRMMLAASAASLIWAGVSLPSGSAAAQPVVQPLPRTAASPVSGSQALNAALARLGRDPRDLDALIEAGRAALGMGDIDAAVGFFARADQLSPNNMRVKAGLAAALVRSENPYDAIPLFADADKAGVLDPNFVSDRGLAYDLVGDNASAQRFYRESLSAAPNDETIRRLALSQAMAGDRAGMEQTLAPLLQRQDKAAWRTRAFALAILQKPEEAIAIADQTMPDDMAQSIAPYLRYMARLTPAQQAAAANFGRFPRASEIGRDDPRVALYAPPKRVAAAAASPTAGGKPLGRNRRSSRDDRRVARADAESVAARSAPPEPAPTRQVTPAPALAVVGPVNAANGAPGELPPVGSAVPSPRVPSAPPAVAPAPAPRITAAPVVTPPTRSAPAVAALAPPPAAVVAPPPARVAAPALPSTTPARGPAVAANNSFNLGTYERTRSAPVAPPEPVRPPSPPAPIASPAAAIAPPAPPAAAVERAAPAPAPVSRPAPASPVASAEPARAAPPVARPAPARRGLADAFAEFVVPKGPAAPAPGAVDVRKLAAAKAKPVEPPKPLYPSRIWVQVGTGRNPAALGFTWKALVRDNPELFRGRSPAMADWGRTNRLLTGPFATESQAEAFLAKLRKAEVDAFLWTSPTGQVVDDLPGR